MLAGYLAAPVAFAWGKDDCALWAAKWVLHCTGEDFTAPWQGNYRTERGAARRMRTLGFASVADIASRHLPERPVAQACRGDLLLHPSDSLGICAGLNGYFLRDGGLLVERTMNCTRAWGVG